jgi:hypothetical protein
MLAEAQEYLTSPTPSRPAAQPIREEIARAIYEIDPHIDSGESIDGFQVTPSGPLSWQQAKDFDAEFATDPMFDGITGFAYKCADAILSLAPASANEVKP